MRLDLLIALALAAGAAAHAPAVDQPHGVVRGKLLDHEGRTVKHAEVRLCTRLPEGTETSAEAWHDVYVELGSGSNSFELPNAWAGPCTLVARFEDASAENLIVHTFVLAEGEVKDLGELRPVGREHSFQFTIVDDKGSDVSDEVLPLPATPEQSVLVDFVLQSSDTATDHLVNWSFARPRGAVVIVRGLDALPGKCAVRASVGEPKLLAQGLRIVGSFSPVTALGGDVTDPARLQLVVAKAWPVDFVFELPEKHPGVDPVWLAVALVDGAGNVRVVDAKPSKGELAGQIPLAAGSYQLYAQTCMPSSREGHFEACTYQVVDVPERGGTLIRIRLAHGVVVTGTLVPRSTEARVGFTALALPGPRGFKDRFHWPEFRLPSSGEFTLYNLPPGAEISFGTSSTETSAWRRFRVPAGGGSLGQIVLE